MPETTREMFVVRPMLESKVTNIRQLHDEPPDEPPVGGVPDWTPDQMTPSDAPPDVSEANAWR